MSTVSSGLRAEGAAATYLESEGYEILEQNYRRPHCEIDIVARLDDMVYFVEVKYRATSMYGGGFDYITAAKLQHMQRAAATWVRERHWDGEYGLSAVEVGGPDYDVLNFIDSLY